MHLELCKNTFGRHGAGDRLRASGTQDANCARRLRDTCLPDEIMAYIDFVCGRTYITRNVCLASSVDGRTSLNVCPASSVGRRTSPECMSGLRLWTDVRPLNVCLDWSSSLAMI